MNHWDTEASKSLKAAQFACWTDDWSDYGRAHIDPLLPDSGCVLDIGCGVGRLAIPIARDNPGITVAGVDESIGMLTHAAQHAQNNTVWLRGDGENLPKLPRLAGAYSMLAFQHMPETLVERYIRQTAELLLPDATFLFQFAESGHHAPLSYHHGLHEMIEQCGHYGLLVTDTFGDDYCPSWRWVTARKR